MNPQSKTVLILEDEKPLLEVIKTKLEIEGFSVVTAGSVNQALNHLKNGVKVDVVWLDHYLFGKEDGLDFVAKIKQKGSEWKNLPVFVVSNTVSPKKVQVYLKSGVEKCYSKVDFRLGQIITDIKEFLETKNEQKTESTERSRRILIVEDETALRNVLADKFTGEGFAVLAAKDGQEGLGLALSNHPDIILLDILMPVMNGTDMLNKLRHDPWGADAAVVLLTNLTDAEKSAVRSPNDSLDYLIKSDWKLEDIVKKVKEKLGTETTN